MDTHALDLSGNTTTFGTVAGTITDGTASWTVATHALAGFSTIDTTDDITTTQDLVIGDNKYIGSTTDKTAIQIESDGDIVLTDAITVAGLATFNGGMAGLGRWNGDFLSETDATDDLGSATYGWVDLYLTGSIELGHDTENTLTASSGVLSIESAVLQKVRVNITDYGSGDDSETAGVDQEGGIMINAADDDTLVITLPTAVAGQCYTILSVEDEVITIDVDGSDQIMELTNAQGDSIDSAGAKGNMIKLCAVDATEWWMMGAIGVWIDGDV
jgi:hypothetical protein